LTFINDSEPQCSSLAVTGFIQGSHARANVAPDAAFRLIQGLHWLLLGLSIITIFGAVAGSHGYRLFG
jgi:hypothetical protein